MISIKIIICEINNPLTVKNQRGFMRNDDFITYKAWSCCIIWKMSHMFHFRTENDASIFL